MVVANPWYNLTNINATGILPIVQSVNNTLMLNQLGNILLIVIFFISYMSFMLFNNNPKLDLMFSSFSIALFSIFFRIFSLVPDFTPFLCVGLFAVTLMIVIFNK